MKESDLIGGFKYKIKCGWGDTIAEYLYPERDSKGKIRYVWQEVGGIRFHSYDLDGVEKV